MTNSALSEQAILAADPQFQARVRGAIVTGSVAVAGATPDGLGVDQAVYDLMANMCAAILANPDTYVDRFSIAVATAPTVTGDMHEPVAIASSDPDLPIAVTTVGPHGLATGAIVQIDGHNGNTAANGTWPVTVISDTTFTIPALGDTSGPQSGTVTQQPSDANLTAAVAATAPAVAGANSST